MGTKAEIKIEEFKDNPEKLREIIDNFLDNKPVPYTLPSFAIAEALELVPGDDAYFIGFLERLDKLRETTGRYCFKGYGVGIAKDEGTFFHTTVKNLADFKSRLERIAEPSRASLEPIYNDLAKAMNETRKNWSPLEHGIREFLGEAEVVVELDTKFVNKFASLLDKYGLKEKANELRQYEETQLKQAEANIELRLKSSDHWHERAAAIHRITDQKYLKDVVSAVPNNLKFGYESPQAIAVSNIYDQPFLERILETKKDVYIIMAAIGNLTNTKLLESYANLTDDECNQHRSPLMSCEQRGEAAHKSEYRDAARKQLWRLGIGRIIEEITFQKAYQRASNMGYKESRSTPAWDIIASLDKKLGFGFNTDCLEIGSNEQDIVIHYFIEGKTNKEVWININPDYLATKVTKEIGTEKEIRETYNIKRT